MPSEPNGRAPEPDPAAFHLTDATVEDRAPWSAAHLPEPAASRGVRIAAIAAAAGLAAAVLITVLGLPIRTAGTQMEPQRFGAAPAPAAAPELADAAPAP
jgi:hypothetical protein